MNNGPFQGNPLDGAKSMLPCAAVHVLCFFACILFGDVLFPNSDLASIVGLQMYFLFIAITETKSHNLDDFKLPTWYIPAAMSVVASLIGIFLGGDPFVCLWLAMVAIFAIQRFFKGFVRADLSVGICLFFSCALLFSNLKKGLCSFDGFAHGVEFVMLAAGFAGALGFRRKRRRVQKKQADQQVVYLLKAYAQSYILGSQVKGGLNSLCENLEKYLVRNQGVIEPQLAEQLGQLQLNLTSLEQTSTKFSQSKSGNKNPFDATSMAQDIVLNKLTSLNELLDKEVNKSVINISGEELVPYQDLAKALFEESVLLPDDLSANVERILSASYKMLDLVKSHPVHKVNVFPFLQRYLKTATEVSREYLELKKRPESEQQAQVLGDAGALLERLAKAFESEHDNLIKNDTMNFSASLHALNEFMKMRGY